MTKLPSPDEIEAAMTEHGGWTRVALAEWGVPWPPPRGWRRRLEREWGKARRTAEPEPRAVAQADSRSADFADAIRRAAQLTQRTSTLHYVYRSRQPDGMMGPWEVERWGADHSSEGETMAQRSRRARSGYEETAESRQDVRARLRRAQIELSVAQRTGVDDRELLARVERLEGVLRGQALVVSESTPAGRRSARVAAAQERARGAQGGKRAPRPTARSSAPPVARSWSESWKQHRSPSPAQQTPEQRQLVMEGLREAGFK